MSNANLTCSTIASTMDYTNLPIPSLRPNIGITSTRTNTIYTTTSYQYKTTKNITLLFTIPLLQYASFHAICHNVAPSQRQLAIPSITFLKHITFNCYWLSLKATNGMHTTPRPQEGCHSGYTTTWYTMKQCTRHLTVFLLNIMQVVTNVDFLLVLWDLHHHSTLTSANQFTPSPRCSKPYPPE